MLRRLTDISVGFFIAALFFAGQALALPPEVEAQFKIFEGDSTPAARAQAYASLYQTYYHYEDVLNPDDKVILARIVNHLKTSPNALAEVFEGLQGSKHPFSDRAKVALLFNVVGIIRKNRPADLPKGVKNAMVTVISGCMNSDVPLVRIVGATTLLKFRIWARTFKLDIPSLPKAIEYAHSILRNPEIGSDSALSNFTKRVQDGTVNRADIQFLQEDIPKLWTSFTNDQQLNLLNHLNIHHQSMIRQHEEYLLSGKITASAIDIELEQLIFDVLNQVVRADPKTPHKALMMEFLPYCSGVASLLKVGLAKYRSTNN